jgi:tRNA nucleotidyltransferase (CCA-adding enzyme)
MAEFKAYVVGGAVRDALLGRPSDDKDWVVVGATPEQMAAAGFMPVGRHFPVFLHPQTREEYALARTERKTAAGYHGFTFHTDPAVTLEQDLARRDLTINAMAFDERGALVDPYGGCRDLEARVLRHVSPAFAEDPVRILRLARFAARFHDFTVALQTQALARHMVDSGEVDALVPERVWQELARGLLEARPSRMLRVLRDCGALARLLPEVDRLWDSAPPSAADVLLGALDISARLGCELPQRFACLGYAVGPDLAALGGLCRRLRVPLECRELAELTAREQQLVECSEALDAAALLGLLERCDALRRPERFEAMLLACECIVRGTTALQDEPFPQRAHLQGVLHAALEVDTAGVAARAAQLGVTGPAVGQAIHKARHQAIAAKLLPATRRD